METRTYTDAELETMIKAGESDLVEFKSSWGGDAKRTARKAVCAFSNDFPEHEKPGVIFIGIDDKGIPTGFQIDDELLNKLSNIKLDGRILPPPSLTIEKRHLKNADIAVITVQPSDAPPTRFEGIVYIRVGSSCAIASAQDERILYEKYEYHNIPDEVRPVPFVTVDNLKRNLFELDYLPRFVPLEVLEKDSRSYYERLAACKMVTIPETPIPTVLGVLVLGDNPRNWVGAAYVQILRLRGTELYDKIADAKWFSNSLGGLAFQLGAYFDANCRVHIDKSNFIERQVWDYPPAAVKELVYNAIMHKSYDTNAPTRIDWYEDRIEVINGGGPYGEVNCRNFGTPGLVDYRNKHLAAAMKTYGYANCFGTGIPLARRVMEKNGSPPIEFVVDQTTVRAILRKNPEYDRCLSEPRF